MNLLLDKPIDYIVVDGRKIELNTDYRLWIEFSIRIQEMTDYNTNDVIDAIKPLIKSTDVYFTVDLLQAIIDFYAFGAERETKSQKPSFDFEFDGNAIYTSFILDYGNILDGQLHWHIFKSLLEGLSEETPLMRRIQIRNMDLSKIDKAKRAEARKLKKSVQLPDRRTPEQKEQDFISQMGGL